MRKHSMRMAVLLLACVGYAAGFGVLPDGVTANPDSGNSELTLETESSFICPCAVPICCTKESESPVTIDKRGITFSERSKTSFERSLTGDGPINVATAPFISAVNAAVSWTIEAVETIKETVEMIYDFIVLLGKCPLSPVDFVKAAAQVFGVDAVASLKNFANNEAAKSLLPSDLAESVAESLCNAIWMKILSENPKLAVLIPILRTLTEQCEAMQGDNHPALAITVEVGMTGHTLYGVAEAGAVFGLAVDTKGAQMCFVSFCLGSGVGYPVDFGPEASKGIGFGITTKAGNIPGVQPFGSAGLGGEFGPYKGDGSLTYEYADGKPWSHFTGMGVAVAFEGRMPVTPPVNPSFSAVTGKCMTPVCTTTSNPQGCVVHNDLRAMWNPGVATYPENQCCGDKDAPKQWFKDLLPDAHCGNGAAKKCDVVVKTPIVDEDGKRIGDKTNNVGVENAEAACHREDPRWRSRPDGNNVEDCEYMRKFRCPTAVSHRRRSGASLGRSANFPEFACCGCTDKNYDLETCIDTPGWTSRSAVWPNNNENCAYFRYNRCPNKGNGFQTLYLGKAYNYPEYNCCGCTAETYYDIRNPFQAEGCVDTPGWTSKSAIFPTNKESCDYFRSYRCPSKGNGYSTEFLGAAYNNPEYNCCGCVDRQGEINKGKGLVRFFDPSSSLVSYWDAGSCGPRGDDASADLSQCAGNAAIVTHVGGSMPTSLTVGKQVTADRYNIASYRYNFANRYNINGCNYSSYVVFKCLRGRSEMSGPTCKDTPGWHPPWSKRETCDYFRAHRCGTYSGAGANYPEGNCCNCAASG